MGVDKFKAYTLVSIQVISIVVLASSSIPRSKSFRKANARDKSN